MLNTMTAYVAAQYTAWASTRVKNGPGDPSPGPKLDYGGGKVNPDVKTGTDNVVATVLYVGVAVFFFYGFLFGLVKKMTGEPKQGARIFLGLFGALICLAPTEVGTKIINGLGNLVGAN